MSDSERSVALDGLEADDTLLYRRQLPGGGYVAIGLVDGGGDAGGSPKLRVMVDEAVVRTQVFVERRLEEERRTGHQPPVIAEADGDASSPAFGDLYRLATDNAAVARALIAWRRRAD